MELLGGSDHFVGHFLSDLLILFDQQVFFFVLGVLAVLGAYYYI